jgi:hypothetical protein
MIPLRFIEYAVPGRTALLTNVPMPQLETIRNFYRYLGMNVKVRYRGPRAGDLERSPTTRKASCLKSKAHTFSVYG